MKTAKILLLTLLMSTFCGALSYAQQGRKPKVNSENRAAIRFEMMKKSLNLTDEQTIQLQESQKQLFEDMKQIRATAKANREDMKAKRDAYHAQLKTILTPEQYQQYQDQRENMLKNTQKKMQKGRKSGFKKGNYKKLQFKDTTAEQ